MTSATDKTCRRRLAKKISQGRKKKNKLLREGTTQELFKLDRPATQGKPK
jgi:hypothetical protein